MGGWPARGEGLWEVGQPPRLGPLGPASWGKGPREVGPAAGGWLWECTDHQGAAPALSVFPLGGQCVSLRLVTSHLVA